MINKLLKAFLISSLFVVVHTGFAQDPHFSQYYANPMFLNPGMTGSVECARINLNYRNQWPSLGDAFVTYSASYDQILNKLRSGIGISFVGDKSGEGGALKRTHISASYSYKLIVNQKILISFGIQGTYSQQKLDWNKLIFGDQIDPTTGTINPSTSETPPSSFDKSYIDFAAGAVLDFNGAVFAGLAVHHLTQPDIGFYDNTDSKLPMKITIHGGASYNLSRGGFGYYEEGDWLLMPNILYQQQNKSQELNFGAYVNKYPFVAGVWLRNSFDNIDAAIVLIGINYANYRIGYSYDFTLSKLSNVSGGAHEISFAYRFCVYKGEKRRKIRAIKAPTF